MIVAIGQSQRLTLPFADRGSASICTNPEGTEYSGNCALKSFATR